MMKIGRFLSKNCQGVSRRELLQVGGLGEAPDLGEELRRLLVREDRLFRELLGHGGIVAEEPPAS